MEGMYVEYILTCTIVMYVHTYARTYVYLNVLRHSAVNANSSDLVASS